MSDVDAEENLDNTKDGEEKAAGEDNSDRKSNDLEPTENGETEEVNLDDSTESVEAVPNNPTVITRKVIEVTKEFHDITISSDEEDDENEDNNVDNKIEVLPEPKSN